MTQPVVLITGASGGLGRATCERFADHGYRVVATDYDAALLKDFADHEPFLTAAVDVTSADSVAAVAALIGAECGRLDVIVNNAGIIGYFPVSEMDPERIIDHFQVNSFGPLRVTHACLDLLQQSHGTVINISSESYRLRNPFQIYQTTKLTLEGISDVLRRELANLDIHVATVRPGAIQTDLFNAMDTIDNPVHNSRLGSVFDAFKRSLEKNKPKRVSTPDAVAALVFRAATDPARRPHYEINNMFALKVANLMPSKWVDGVMRKTLSG